VRVSESVRAVGPSVCDDVIARLSLNGDGPVASLFSVEK